MLNKPQDTSGSFLKNTLRRFVLQPLLVTCSIIYQTNFFEVHVLSKMYVLLRLSKHKLEKLWAEHIGSLSDYGETYKGFSGSYWSFSRQPIVQSLSRLSEQDEPIALQMFQIILKYAGLGQNGIHNKYNYIIEDFRIKTISLND